MEQQYKLYYSASLNTFLMEGLNELPFPDDIVEITPEYRYQLSIEQAEGGILQPDSKGYPIVVPPVLVREEVIKVVSERIRVYYEQLVKGKFNIDGYMLGVSPNDIVAMTGAYQTAEMLDDQVEFTIEGELMQFDLPEFKKLQISVAKLSRQLKHSQQDCIDEMTKITDLSVMNKYDPSTFDWTKGLV